MFRNIWQQFWPPSNWNIKKKENTFNWQLFLQIPILQSELEFQNFEILEFL